MKEEIQLGKQRTKKAAALMVSIALATSMLTGSATAAGSSISVVLDGLQAPLGSAVIENGATMVPIRFVSEKLGANVSWDGTTKKVSINKNGKSIILTVGSASAKIDGVDVKLDAKVIRKEGAVLVPLRLVGEQLAAEVEWNADRNTVYIHTPGKEIGEVDPFGRKIRTTNLPKNYKDYPYILADIPNEMYEMGYPGTIERRKKVSKQLYDAKVFTTDDLTKIMKRITEGYEMILNVDYKTIDVKTWGTKFFSYMNQSFADYKMQQNNKYAHWVKKNQIQIEGSIKPEPSMLYNAGTGGWYIRSKIIFKIKSYNEDKQIIHDEHYMPSKFKKGIWYEGYVDLWIGSNVYGGDLGDHVAISGVTLFYSHNMYRKVSE
ncbi:copper amine oxidase N-terminal domain-containing protein [Paenibacillus oenotherae]|uniref:Copper amine oxidase N-terminal domain-containing protein n=1 Tax=Paenibacillus oenotherae TaxID=1435645 RepID=A0ABS7D5K3_9BACL|nr:copper amine oxidase N-terminal domain-containing protein [Paenibacillus oenotherae]MBW7475222.1 copper amine oxidase N-terminal domain-containing protein [Paenibacillus oenotherae]